jgi:hypothetical protein
MAYARKGHLAMRCCSGFRLQHALCALIGMLALAGWAPGAQPMLLGHHPPPWRFVWSAPTGISQSVDLANAYAQAGRVIHNGGAPQLPAATTWLASGPAFGMAVVQLDPAGTFFDLVTVEVDAETHTWTGGGATLPGGDCGDPGSAYGPLTFPLKVCQSGNGGKYATPSSPSRYAYTWWYSGASVFILYRWNPIDLRPTADATTVEIGGHPGWLTTHGAYSSVVVRTTSHETVLFSGTASPTMMEQLTAEALTDLDTLVPLLSGPPTPPGAPPTPTPTP